MRGWRRLSHKPILSLQRCSRLIHSLAKPIVDISGATFYRRHPSTQDQDLLGSNPPLFPGLKFSIYSGQDGGSQTERHNWAVISPSSRARSTFLQILAGQHVVTPANARTYPLLSETTESSAHAIRLIGFDADRAGVRPAHASARYESRREVTEPSLRSWLLGRTTPAALIEEAEGLSAVDENLSAAITDAVGMLNLTALLDLPVSRLSNGQTRRARVAQALVARPRLLLLDAPFIGLDPRSAETMTGILGGLAEQGPRVVVSLGLDDAVPPWISHVVVLGSDLKVLAQGSRDKILGLPVGETKVPEPKEKLSSDGVPMLNAGMPSREIIVEMRGAKVAYSGRTVLGAPQQESHQGASEHQRPGIWWQVRRGERWGVFGANGSGKTTLLSLVTSDHPQSYGQPVLLFGKSRLPAPGEPGISVFDLQKRIGHASPEVHALFPRQLSLRRALQSAWADAPLAPPQATPVAKRRVDACLRWFASELAPDKASRVESFGEVETLIAQSKIREAQDAFDTLIADGNDLVWADSIRFGELAFSQQRLMLFLRAIVSAPDLVILDEALSGMDATLRERALLFLAHGESVASIDHAGGASKLQPSNIARLDRVAVSGLSSKQALLVVAHRPSDLPGIVQHWLCLPDPETGGSMRTGRLEGPIELHPDSWDDIWGLK